MKKKKTFLASFTSQKDEAKRFTCYGCPLFSIRYYPYEHSTLECGIIGIVINDNTCIAEKCPFNEYETITIKRITQVRKNKERE